MNDELRDVRIPVMMSRSEVQAIDRWRGQQPDVPSRSEAIRRLIDLGLKASARGGAGAGNER